MKCISCGAKTSVRSTDYAAIEPHGKRCAVVYGMFPVRVRHCECGAEFKTVETIIEVVKL